MASIWSEIVNELRTLAGKLEAGHSQELHDLTDKVEAQVKEDVGTVEADLGAGQATAGAAPATEAAPATAEATPTEGTASGT